MALWVSGGLGLGSYSVAPDSRENALGHGDPPAQVIPKLPPRQRVASFGLIHSLGRLSRAAWAEVVVSTTVQGRLLVRRYW